MLKGKLCSLRTLSIAARLVRPIARQQSFFIGRYTIILLHLVGTVSFVEFVSSVGATRCGDPPALFEVAVGNVLVFRPFVAEAAMGCRLWPFHLEFLDPQCLNVCRRA